MKKCIKQIIAMLVAGIMLLSSSILASAENVKKEASNESYAFLDNDFDMLKIGNIYNVDGRKMQLVKKEKYVNDGIETTECLYISRDLGLKAGTVSGNGTFRNEKTEKYQTSTLKYYVQGYFSWNGKDNITVSNTKGGVINAKECHVTIEDSNKTSGSNQGGWPGQKYAYVRYTATSKNSIGMKRSLNAYVDVNVLGQTSSN